MNHELIESLVALYLELPHQSPESAARRVAVLVEMEMASMEKSGDIITRQSLHNRVKAAIEEHKRQAA